jgi:energy-coupling factor transporter ATP-binding protein EcfA2
MPPSLPDITIRKIELVNFRAFHGVTNVIDLSQHQSLIVLGENGSGKSSLYYALKDFFTLDKSTMDIAGVPYRNFFALTEDTAVRIKFSDGDSYEWSNATDTFPDLVGKGIDTTKGFIDYKSLLQTYYGQQRANTVNIFEFLVSEILLDLKPLGSGQTVGAMWREISAARPDKRRPSTMNALRRLLENFNAALRPTIEALQARAQEILERFKLNLQIEIIFPGVDYNSEFTEEDNVVLNQRINLIVNFYGARHENHHHFLNEARLSAVAISLFFASFQLQPTGRIKLMVLDDVLIGLDMQNRVPVLDILAEYFSDFQVFLFTFDRLWFDNLRPRFPNFQTLELQRLKGGAYETIGVRRAITYLEKAEEYYVQGEAEIAANFVRKYYEQIIKDFCRRKRLVVCSEFQEDVSKIPASAFWGAICSKTNKISLDHALRREIEACQTNVNNPLSHAGNPGVHSTEVERAIEKVKELKAALDAIKTNS